MNYRITPLFSMGLLLVGCASDINQTVSISDAKQTALEYSQPDFTPPVRSIDNIRQAFSTYHRDTGTDCKTIQVKRDKDLRSILGRSGKTDYEVRVAASHMSDASEKEFLYGNIKNAIEYSTSFYNELPSDGQGIRKAVLASNIGRMQVRLGNNSIANKWFALASSKWSRMGSDNKNGSKSPKALANIYTIEASKAFMANDLIAEEYYYRKALSSVWKSRYVPWVSVNAEYTVTRLAQNLIAQGRPIEAELIARLYLIKYVEFAARTGNTSEYDKPLLTNILAESLYAQNRLSDAEYLARLSLAIHAKLCSLEDSIPITEARRTLINILATQGQWRKLQSLNSDLKLKLSKKPGRYQKLFGANANLILADLFGEKNGSESGITARIAAAKSQVIMDNGQGSLSELELEAVSAINSQRMGNYVEAIESYSSSIVALQDFVLTSNSHSNRYQIYKNSFIEFLASPQGSKSAQSFGLDPVKTSFELANGYNLGKVQRNLSMAALRANSNEESLSRAMRDVLDLGHQAQNIFDHILFLQSAPVDQVDNGTIKDLVEKHRHLVQAKKQLEQQITEKSADYGQLLNPQIPDLNQLTQSLRPGELLVTYYLGKQNSYAWSLKQHGQLSIHAIDLSEKELDTQIATLRQALEPKGSTLGDIPAFDLTLAHNLYQSLLGGLLGDNQESVTDLIIIPNGSLGILPMGLLVTDGNYTHLEGVTMNPTQEIVNRGIKRIANTHTVSEDVFSQNDVLFDNYRNVSWLINRYSVSVVPSATSLILLRSSQANANKTQATFIGFGDPLFTPRQLESTNQIIRQSSTLGLRGSTSASVPLNLRAVPNTRETTTANISILPPLPETRAEIEEIAQVLGADIGTAVYLGSRASESNLKKLKLENKNVIIFATHGLIPGDLDGLNQPALALANPISSASEGDKEDGLLTMQEVLGLRLNADWVILSACNTASGDGEGAEAFSGLGQAFFYAGAKSLLLSNWSVESTSARILTTGIFKALDNQPSLSRAKALQASITSLITKTDQKNAYSYAHPIFWAPFTLVGDGG